MYYIKVPYFIRKYHCEGWTRVKAKVGSQAHEDDARRLKGRYAYP